MQNALAPLGLGYVIREGQLIVQRQNDASRVIGYSLTDLVANDPQSKSEFATLVTKSLNAASVGVGIGQCLRQQGGG